MRIILFLISIILLSLTSCTKEGSVTQSTGLNYFPIEEGLYVIYEVDSIHIQSSVEVFDTVHYQIKELQDSLFFDVGGNRSMRIKRFRRAEEGDTWELKDIWTAHRNAASAQRVEENERLLVLAFPPSVDRQWDRNTFNTKDQRIVAYTSYHNAYQLDALNFDSVATVQFEYEFNLIERNSGRQIYASQVGMIFSEISDITMNDITPVDQDLTVEDIASASIVTHRLIEYGNE